LRMMKVFFDIYKLLSECLFTGQFLMTVSATSILIGTYYLSKSVFLTNIASKYWLRDRYGLDWKWKITAWIFGINEHNWTTVFTSDDQLAPEERKRVRDDFASIKGFGLITIGTVFQIVAIWLF